MSVDLASLDFPSQHDRPCLLTTVTVLEEVMHGPKPLSKSEKLLCHSVTIQVVSTYVLRFAST